MLRDKLINLISDELFIDETFIFEDANLHLLCILSYHLEGLDDIDKKKVKINKDGLKKKTLENITYRDRNLFFNIKFLFENNGNKSVIYKDRRGRDGFYEFQMLKVYLILTIENKFDIQISDNQWSKIITIGQTLSYAEETINNNNNK